MKKYFVIFLLLFIFYSGSILFAQKYAILRPTKPGVKSDVIPISKKQLKKLLKNETRLSNHHLFNFQTGILDTITHWQFINVNFGIVPGDTVSSYYEPGVACHIRAVGIIGQSWYDEILADGYHLMIHKPAHPWLFPLGKWTGDGCYTKDSLGYTTLLGEKMWGDVSVPIIDGERVWTEMGSDVDSYGEGFVVSVAPFGGAYMGTDAGSYSGESDVPRLVKYYQKGRAGHEPQWVVRNFSCTWFIVVEFFGYPPMPWLNPETYGNVLNSDAKPLRCWIIDLDAQSPDQAGIDSAKVYYQVNDGDYTIQNMYLVSGTIEDGMWEAVLPAGYMEPGDTLTYWFEAIDNQGNVGESAPGSFRYFKKTTELLVFYNDDGGSYPPWILHPYYDNLWTDHADIPIPYDIWVGISDGPLTPELINQYDYLVQIDAYSPATMNDDVIGAWLESGYRGLFWSSQEWAGHLCGGWDIDDDTTFAPDDWHYKYLGIEYIGGAGHDIATDPFPINPVRNDWISGGLAEFLGDSLQLYLNCSYELGFKNWADAIIPTDEATVCFTDSALGRVMGIHTLHFLTKTVFLSFDQLCLDAQSGYYWTEPNISSVVGNALRYFTPINNIEDSANKVAPIHFDLKQNYPNPFNAETRISYTISEPVNVQLSIYNIAGQKIAELVNEKQDANSYQINWDAGGYPSGVYFCRIEAGGYSNTKKMILVR